MNYIIYLKHGLLILDKWLIQKKKFRTTLLLMIFSILKAIKDAEADMEIAKLNAMKAREALEQAKLKLRETQHDGLLFISHYINVVFRKCEVAWKTYR